MLNEPFPREAVRRWARATATERASWEGRGTAWEGHSQSEARGAGRAGALEENTRAPNTAAWGGAAPTSQYNQLPSAGANCELAAAKVPLNPGAERMHSLPGSPLQGEAGHAGGFPLKG